MPDIRTLRGKKVVHESRPVSINYVTVDEAIEELEGARHDLIDGGIVEIEAGTRYGDSYVIVTVSGNRLATAEEIAQERRDRQARRKRDQDRQQSALDSAIALIRQERPDLLK
jgi:predicted RNA-binding protein with PUA domain